MAGPRTLNGKIVLQVYLLDNSYKTLLIEPTSTVYDVCRSMADKIGFEDPEDDSLCFSLNECLDGVTISRALPPEREVLSIMEGWFGKPDAKFVFQCKLYTDSIINSKDPKIVHLLFIQAVYAVITGAYPTAEKDAVQLAAWQFQAKFGGHNPSTHKAGFLTATIVEYVPAPHVERAGSPARAALVWENMIFHKHAFSTTPSPRETYLSFLAKRDYYGAVLFAVKQRYDRSLPRKLFLGISRRGIVLLRVPTRPPEEDMETLARFALADIYRWAYKPGVNFYFEIKADDAGGGGGFGSAGGDGANPVFTFDTGEGKHMSDMLTDYAMALLREMGLNPDGSKRVRPRDRAAAAAAEAMAAQAAAAQAAAQAAAAALPPPPPPPVSAPALPPPLPTRAAMASTADAYRHVGGDVGALASAALRSGETDPAYAPAPAPADAYLPPPLPSVAPPAPPAAAAAAGERPLPPNWIKCYDEASADYYYFNTISGESVWEEADVPGMQ